MASLGIPPLSTDELGLRAGHPHVRYTWAHVLWSVWSPVLAQMQSIAKGEQHDWSKGMEYCMRLVGPEIL
eukprot:8932590-Heterocapsa_arctica.AAC.1